jgi:hypothetical protein
VTKCWLVRDKHRTPVAAYLCDEFQMSVLEDGWTVSMESLQSVLSDDRMMDAPVVLGHDAESYAAAHERLCAWVEKTGKV